MNVPSRRRQLIASSIRTSYFLAGMLLLSVTAQAQEDIPTAVKSAAATHKQKTIVTVANSAKGEKLEDFCIDSKGRILALMGQGESEQGFAIPFLGKAKPAKFACEVRVYDATGKMAAKWEVGFTGQAINTAPDGTIVVGGDGHVARFDAEGKKLHEAESPQMTYISKNTDEMRERAKEQLESDRVTYAEQVKQFEELLKQAKEAKKKAEKKSSDKKNTDKDKPAKKNDADSEDEPAEEELGFGEDQLEQIVTSYKNMSKQLETRTVDEVLKEVMARARRTHSITAGEKDVFVSCPALAGYGFGVWRTDEKFGQAKEIIKSLSGCCGQMDVQCHNDELYVCENSRHRVVRFDRDGKELAQFGERDRTGEGASFGGCCNPMNLCFNKQGDLYVSESNGVVKHFTPAGKYLGIVGIADVQAGCKNSCVGVTADDSKLFYIDIYKSRIIVLDRDEKVSKK